MTPSPGGWWSQLNMTADPRVLRLGLGSAVASLVAFGTFGLTGAVWLVWVAVVALTIAVLVLVALEDERRRREEAEARAAKQGRGAADRGTPRSVARQRPTPVDGAATGESSQRAAAAAGPVPMARVHAQGLHGLLLPDFEPLPAGMVWPDLGRLRGSLATRVQLAMRVPMHGPLPAGAPDAPGYARFAGAIDVASGLHVAALGHRGLAPVVLLEASLHPGLSQVERLKLDDTVTDTWYGPLGGILTPPRLLAALVGVARDPAGPGGAQVLEVLEQARVSIRAARSFDAACRRWAEWRARIALEAARQHWSERQRDVAEVTVDWLFVQRGAVDDVEMADRERAHGETRGDALLRADAAGALRFEAAVAICLDSSAVGRYAPEAARAAGTALGPMLAAA
jgi:hypothetical protein